MIPIELELPSHHSAAHYPIAEASGGDRLQEEFDICEDFIEAALGQPSRYWVLPFDREGRRDPRLFASLARSRGSRTVVLVGNRVNRCLFEDRRLYRIGVPVGYGGKELFGLLRTIDRKPTL